MASILTNAQLAKQYPKDSVWVVKVENGVRTELLYHGNDVNKARTINSKNESVLVQKKVS